MENSRKWFSLALVLLAQCNLAQCSSNNEIQKPVAAHVYQKVDKYLSQKVASDTDIEGNFNAAERLLNEMKGRLHLRDSSYDKMNLLRDLVEMKEAFNECTFESYKSFAITGEKFRAQGGRLARFVQVASEEHIENCLDVLVTKKDTQIASMDPEELSCVNEHTDIAALYVQTDEPSTLRKGIRAVKGTMKLERSSDFYRDMLAFAKKKMRENPDEIGEDRYPKSRHLRMCNKYIVEPCEHYADQVGDTLDLWEFSSKLTNNTEAEKYSGMNAANERYKICEYLRANRVSLYSELGKINTDLVQ